MEIWREKNLVLLKNAIGNIELTDAERITLEWLSGCERATVENLVSIIQKTRGADTNKNR